MEIKTPEDLAWEESKYSKWENDDYSINTVKKAFLAGYAAGKPKWINAKAKARAERNRLARLAQTKEP